MDVVFVGDYFLVDIVGVYALHAVVAAEGLDVTLLELWEGGG